ncbi:MAG: YciI family protein [Actinophytocola sp.]|uniref:YciI family protein n=1 Tax=Actinophytocola sp. TaxID=1872138 RepID=UPI003C76670F
MKQYLLAVQWDESAPTLSEEEMQENFARTGKVTDEMKSAGSWVFVGGLLPSHATTVVRPDNGTTTMTDGPFAETKEQLGGFWVIQCENLDQALSWAERCALACRCPIEVRPFNGSSE